MALGSNRLRDSLAATQRDGRKLLLPYVTAGYPDIMTTIEILARVDTTNIGGIELGFPFSDPIADGPVIQASFTRALEAGFRVAKLFEALRAARSRIRVPLIAMVSYSIVSRLGESEFLRAAREAGFDAVIVPDLSLDEAGGLAEVGRRENCALVRMATPTTAPDRLRRIAELSDPFIYYQAVAGITGERAALPADLGERVAAVKKLTPKPVFVGFGISGPQQVRDVCAISDGAIVGSALVRRMTAALDRGATRSELAVDVTGFIADLAAATE